MSDETTKKAEWAATAWKANLFPVDVANLDLPKLFEQFYGIEHDEERSKPAEGTSELWASETEVTRHLFLSPGKLEFQIRPRNTSPLPETIRDMGILVFPKTSAFPKEFAEQTVSFVGSTIPLRRIGAAVQYAMSASTYDEAREFLAPQLISVATIDAGTSDFLFRINRPRTFSYDGRQVTINRLCQWLTQGLNFEVTDVRSNEVKVFNKVLTALIPDVNTEESVDLSDFPAEAIKKLTKTLFDYAEEFAIKGEAP